MSRLETPIICVVIGEGGSGGALGIGVGDRVAVLEFAYYSVISPEGCAGILWKSHQYAERAATALKFTSADLLRLKVVDHVIERCTRPGDLVFGPFAGFGTTLARAVMLGRRALGIELLPERVADMRRRIPGATVIETRRDPLETAWSCFKQQFYGQPHFANDLEDIAAHLLGCERAMDAWRARDPARPRCLPAERISGLRSGGSDGVRALRSRRRSARRATSVRSPASSVRGPARD